MSELSPVAIFPVKIVDLPLSEIMLSVPLLTIEDFPSLFLKTEFLNVTVVFAESILIMLPDVVATLLSKIESVIFIVELLNT